MSEFEGEGAHVSGQFPQPESNDAGAVKAALLALRSAHDEPTSREAHDAFLCAVGNNHAGTYYPVILAVLPDVEKILVSGTAWAQRATMEALIDLGAHSCPRGGTKTIRVPRCSRHSTLSSTPCATTSRHWPTETMPARAVQETCWN